MSVVAVALLAACGSGGGDDAPAAGSPPAPAPPSGPAPLPPLPTVGPSYYFSDCASGAAAGCVPGDDSRPGTDPALPRRSLAGFGIASLPAGSTLHFRRGGAWDWPTLRLENLNATAASPLVFDAYGSGPAPVLRIASGPGIEFGDWQNDTDDHGYVFRNLKFDGLGTGQWGIWLRGRVSEVVIENNEFTGFYIAINSQGGGDPISRISVLGNLIQGNRGMGMLGHYDHSLIAGNEFRGNNFTGSAFNHGLYVSSNNVVTAGLQIRDNRFIDNSVVSGQCTGGNLTLHGQYDGVQITGNVFSVPASSESCYGISATSGYAPAPGFPSDPEFFRNMVISGNTLTNLGGCSICTNSAPNVLIERNTVYKTQNAYTQAVAIGAPENDGPGGGEVIRDNLACLDFPQNNPAFPAFGTNNTVRVGPDARTGVCAR